MSVVRRGVVFFGGTIANAILFIFHSRVLLSVTDIANSFPSGPATPAIELLPQAVMGAILIIQVGLIAYFLGAFGEQRTATQGPA